MSNPSPDMEGVARAWRLDYSDEVTSAHEARWGHAHAGLCTWIVHGPYHPFWSWWYVSVISLKDIPGVPPAQKKYVGAEFEFSIFALDGVPNIDALRAGDLANRRLLFPPDVQFHFDGVTDEQAIEICEAAVVAIVGGVSCDSDMRQWWLDSLKDTVAHYREGRH